MNISFAGGGLTPTTQSFTTSDLVLSGIPFLPGRTVDMSIGDGIRVITLGKLCLLDILGLSVRFGEAGATSTIYFGLPTSIPRVSGTTATSPVRSHWGNSVGTASWIEIIMAPDIFDSGHNYVQMTRYTTALVTQAWPVTPAARYGVAGQLWFTTI